MTTADSTPLLIINGPIRKQLDVNDSFNVFGQGWRANATIGRTIRLIGTNIGGALPGELDRSTLGHAGKYTFCIAEREEVSLWQPLHVERGFQPSDSTVTVHAGSSPYHIGSSGNTAEGILDTICHSISALGPPSAEIVLVFTGLAGERNDRAPCFVQSRTAIVRRHYQGTNIGGALHPSELDDVQL